MSKSTPDPPKEAKLILDKDYSYLIEYGPCKWLLVLTELYELSVRHKVGLHEVDFNTYTLGGEEESGEVSELMTVQAAIPTFQFIEANSEGVWIPPGRLPALLIDARALDKVIHGRFEDALKELRKLVPPPRARPGPWAPNTSIDQDTFSYWIEWRIVQLAELLVWRKTLDTEEAKLCYDWVIGVWMWGAKVDPKKIHDATKILKRAIACRHMLMSQTEHEPPPSLAHVTEQAIIKQLVKDIACAREESEISLPEKINVLIVKKIDSHD